MSAGQVVFYFLFGGAVVTAITYLGSTGRGFWAAFVAALPVITLVTFATLYKTSGAEACVQYARGLMVMTIPWFLYVLSTAVLIRRLGIPALFVGAAVFLLAAFFVRRLVF